MRRIILTFFCLSVWLEIREGGREWCEASEEIVDGISFDIIFTAAEMCFSWRTEERKKEQNRRKRRGIHIHIIRELISKLTMLIRNRQRHLPIPRPGRRSSDHEIKDFVAVARNVAVEKSLESDVAIVGAEGGEAPESGVHADGTDYCGDIVG